MDIAIVTGASSSLGLAISRRLIQLGFRVYGLGGDYADCPLNNVNFRPVSCDLADPTAVEAACRKILDTEKGVFLVVNNAKYFGRNPFMQMESAEIERILRINLLCPLIMIKTLGESIKNLQGYLIQLGAPYAETSRGGAAGAAASGGLKWMGDVLFHELREHGVKVCHLSPEPNRGREGPGKSKPGARPEAVIDPEAVAQAVEQILQSPFGNVVTEMILRPLRIQEPSQEPVREIPYPEPQPIPYTVPREYIEAEDQLEEEEYQKQQQAKRERRQTKKSARKATKKATSKTDSKKPQQSAGKSEAAGGQRAETKVSREDIASGEPAEQEKPRRKSRRKPRPPKVEVGFLAKKEDSPAEEKKAPADKGEGKSRSKQSRAPRKRASGKKDTEKTDQPAETSARKNARKRPARKAAKKATKKAARKSPTKKVARKPEKGKESA